MLKQTWLLISGILILCLSGHRLFYPTLHIDESLYVGAAMRILSGDLFLTSYWFDKFFLPAAMLIPGILVAGPNGLGFHLSGVIASITGALIFISLCVELAGKHMALRCVAGIAATLLMTAPFMLFYHASSFTEPFLLLFLMLFARELYRASSLDLEVADKNLALRRAYRWFALAAIVKLSAAMWAPMLGLYWWHTGKLARGRDLLARVRDFFQATWVYWAIALFYSLTNPGKLAPILWFKGLTLMGAQSASQPSLISRLFAWFTAASETFSHPALFIVIAVASLTLVLMTAFVMWRRQLRNFSFWLFVVPSGLHAFGLWLSGASVFDRYLYILWPQVLFAAIVSAHLIVANYRVQIQSLAILLLATIAAGFLIQDLTPDARSRYLRSHVFDASWGRGLHRIAEELPSDAVVHNIKRLWFLYPYLQQNGGRQACDQTPCYEEEQAGRQPFGSQFRLTEQRDNDSANERDTRLDIEQLLISDCKLKDCTIKQESEVFDISKLLSVENIRNLLRLGFWAEHITITPTAGSSNSSTQSIELSGLMGSWKKVAAAPVKITITTRDLPQIGSQTLDIHGQLVPIRSRLAARNYGNDRWVLGLRLESIRFAGSTTNYVDLAPIIYRSYTQLLGPLPTSGRMRDYESFAEFNWNDTNDMIESKIFRSERSL